MSTPNSHNDWWTPQALFDCLNGEFQFELDAAADVWNRKCEKYISEEQDALITPWEGRTVWCNPPYGKGWGSDSLTHFVRRGYEQHVEQKNTIVMLLPAYTDPKYWGQYVMLAHEVRFLKGRLQFLDHGHTKQSARFPSVVVIWKYIPGYHYGKAPNQWVWDWRVGL